MNVSEKEHQRRSGIIFLVGLILLILLFGLMGAGIWNALMPVWLGALLAYAFFPSVRALEKRMSRTKAVALVVSALVIIFLSALFWLIPLAIKQATEVIENIPQYTGQLLNRVPVWQAVLDEYAVPINLQEVVRDLSGQLSGYVGVLMTRIGEIAARLPGVVVVLFLTPFFIFYFLNERERFVNGLLYYVPFHIRPLFRSIGHGINVALGKFFRAQLLIAVITGVLTTIAYFIVGQSYALLFGFVMGVLSIFPYIGPVLGAIPPILVSLFSRDMQWVPTLLSILVIQQVIGTVIAPRVMGKELRLHAAYIFLALLVGGSLGGIWGTLLAIPVTLIVLTVAREIFTYITQLKRHVG